MDTAEILVVEDEPAVRDAVCSELEATPGFKLAGVIGSFEDAQSLIEVTSFDVALIDLDLNGRSGLPLVSQTAGLGRKSMVLSLMGDEANVVAAIEAGAAGYILKAEGLDRVPRAVLAVLRDEAPLSPAVARHLLKRFKPEAGPDPLTRREREVLEQFARGATYVQTAEALGISVYTLGDYVKTLYRKLQVSSRSSAVHAAVKSGLLKF